jgi:hypothetical protein
MLFRIRKPNTTATTSEEPEAGRPAGTGEEWLGRNRSAKRRLWERLNPRHRKELRVIAEALAMQQNACEPAGAVAGAVEPVHRASGAPGAANRGAAGGGNTADTTPLVTVARAWRATPY